jgi:hypothetical protein
VGISATHHVRSFSFLYDLRQCLGRGPVKEEQFLAQLGYDRPFSVVLLYFLCHPLPCCHSV